MRLYAGTTRDFVADATRNTIARRLENAFVSYFRYRPIGALPASGVRIVEVPEIRRTQLL